MPRPSIRLTHRAGLVRLAAVAVAGTVALAPAAGAWAEPQAAPAGKARDAATAGPRVMPLPKGSYRLSAGFGVAGPMWSSGYHTGQDLSAPSGTPILAAAGGTVVFTGDGGRYGMLTEIAHTDGAQTWYAHQSAIGVRVGARVTAGQRIGAVGSTGNSTGPHLHFELRVGGRTVDPMPWLAGAPAVAGTGPMVQAADPARAAELRAQLAEAEDVRRNAEAWAASLRARAAQTAAEAAGAQRAADDAQRRLTGYARDVYKAGGLDPQWILQADALAAGDARGYADRQVYLRYSNGAQQRHLAAAIEASRRAAALRDDTARLGREADEALAAATAKMDAIQAQIESAGWSWASEGQWDGVIPEGGSATSQAAVRFALSQVGRRYSPAGTGPSYSCSGLMWRAWREAGLRWPVMMAHDQATTRKWVVPVPAGQEQPGDLVFFRVGNGTDSRPNAIDHVGMVINPATGSFVHASSPRTGVEVNNYVTSAYYRDHRVVIGRVATLSGR